MKIFYWSPHIDQVATVRAVINSAHSLCLYSKKKYTPHIINVAGEWDQYLSELNKKNIKIIDLTNSKIIKNKNVKGFLRSRIIYFYIFFVAFFPLLRLLKNNRPDYFIAHLITPLPLLINYLFNIKTKFILRISGLPKLKNLRLFIWKITLKKVDLITCPTLGTRNYIKEKKLISQEKIFLLYDPVISPKLIQEKKKIPLNNFDFDNYFLSIGRLTKQKNFTFLVNVFKEFNKNKNHTLIIIGEGEERDKIEKIIKDNNLYESVFLIGYKNNVLNYFKRSKCFILSSLWEDPGFVLIEAGYMNVPIISSDCKNGPIEFLNNGNGGILFNSNNEKSLLDSFNKFESLEYDQINKFRINSKKSSRNFSIFKHYKELSLILKK